MLNVKRNRSLTLFTKFKSAPAATSTFTTSACFLSVANMSAVEPSCHNKEIRIRRKDKYLTRVARLAPKYALAHLASHIYVNLCSYQPLYNAKMTIPSGYYEGRRQVLYETSHKPRQQYRTRRQLHPASVHMLTLSRTWTAAPAVNKIIAMASEGLWSEHMRAVLPSCSVT